MHIPPQDKSRCPNCRAFVVMCATAAKSKGHPVVVAVDVLPDVHGANPRKQVAVSILRGKYFAGKFATVAKRDAAAAAGVQLHQLHSATCKPPASRWTRK